MTNLERPVRVVRKFSKGEPRISSIAKVHASVADEKVLALEVVRGERRSMAKEVLTAVVLLFGTGMD